MINEIMVLGIETKLEIIMNQLLNDKKITGQFSHDKLDELHKLAQLYEQVKFEIINFKEERVR